MSIYLIIELGVLIIAFMCCIIPTRANIIDNKNIVDKSNNTLYMLICIFILSFIGGFRGDFTQDFSSYVYSFQNSNFYSIQQIIFDQSIKERGFLLLNKLVRIFTDKHEILFTIISFIILICYFIQFRRNSKYVWLSIFMFLCLGSYYISFNLTRQILSVGLFTLSLENIYNQKLAKYIVNILLISNIHSSVLLMLPFYFILNIKWNKKNGMIIFLVFGLVFAVTYISPYKLIGIFQSFIGKNYTMESYGMIDGLSFETILKPLISFIFIITHIKFIDLTNIKYRVWFNSSIFYFIFSVLSLKLSMFTRFTHYFSFAILILIPNIIYKMKKEKRLIYLYVLIIGLLIYSGISRGFFSSNYYFNI